MATVKIKFKIGYHAYSILMRTLKGREGFLEQHSNQSNDWAELYFEDYHCVPNAMVKYKDPDFDGFSFGDYSIEDEVIKIIMQKVDIIDENKAFCDKIISDYKAREAKGNSEEVKKIMRMAQWQREEQDLCNKEDARRVKAGLGKMTNADRTDFLINVDKEDVVIVRPEDEKQKKHRMDRMLVMGMSRMGQDELDRRMME